MSGQTPVLAEGWLLLGEEWVWLEACPRSQLNVLFFQPLSPSLILSGRQGPFPEGTLVLSNLGVRPVQGPPITLF